MGHLVAKFLIRRERRDPFDERCLPVLEVRMRWSVGIDLTFRRSVLERYLVDPASSHMLVSKIKPCMSKFTLFHGETANGSLNQSRFLR